VCFGGELVRALELAGPGEVELGDVAQPAPALVTFRPRGGRARVQLRLLEPGLGLTRYLELDGDGAEVELPAGRWVLAALAPDTGTGTQLELALSPGERRQVDLELSSALVTGWARTPEAVEVGDLALSWEPIPPGLARPDPFLSSRHRAMLCDPRVCAAGSAGHEEAGPWSSSIPPGRYRVRLLPEAEDRLLQAERDGPPLALPFDEVVVAPDGASLGEVRLVRQ
jgi:hypothetical protein